MPCNMCAMCGGSATTTPNFQKQVDPHVQRYGTILGDAPPMDRRRNYGKNMAALQVCLPTFAGCPPMAPPCPPRSGPGQQPVVVNVPRDGPQNCPKIICEPCPPPPPTKVWLIKSSPMPPKVMLRSLLFFLMSFAIAQPPPCIPLSNQPIFIPCQRPC